MESIQEPSLDERVKHVLNHHFTDPRAENLRAVLSYLGLREGEEIGTGELRNVVTGASTDATSRVLRRLNRLLDEFGETLGLKLIQTRRTSAETFYRLVFLAGSVVTNKTKLATLSHVPTHLPLDEASFRRTSRLISLPLLQEPPSEKETTSLFTNARFVRPEDNELEYLRLLTEAARRKMSCSFAWLRSQLDIPVKDKRLLSNFRQTTVDSAAEIGFVVDALRSRHHGIFFVNHDARERVLLEKFSGKNEVNTCLDKTIAFDGEILEARLKKINLLELPREKRKAIRLIAQAQAEAKPIHRGEFLRQSGFTKEQYGYLHHKSQVKRYDWGFYIRMRSDDTMQCVLIDTESIDQSE